MNPNIPEQNPVNQQPQEPIQPLPQNSAPQPQQNPIVGFVIIFILLAIVISFAYQGFLEGLTYIKSNPLSIFAGLLTVVGITAIFYLSRKTIKIKVAPNSFLSNLSLSGDINLAVALILWVFSIVIFVSVFFIHDSSSSVRYDPRGVSAAILTLIGDFLWFRNK